MILNYLRISAYSDLLKFDMKMFKIIARLDIGHLFIQSAKRGHQCTLDTFLVVVVVVVVVVFVFCLFVFCCFFFCFFFSRTHVISIKQCEELFVPLELVLIVDCKSNGEGNTGLKIDERL